MLRKGYDPWDVHIKRPHCLLALRFFSVYVVCAKHRASWPSSKQTMASCPYHISLCKLYPYGKITGISPWSGVGSFWLLGGGGGGCLLLLVLLCMLVVMVVVKVVLLVMMVWLFIVSFDNTRIIL